MIPAMVLPISVSNILEKLEFKLQTGKKLLGLRNMQEKLEKAEFPLFSPFFAKIYGQCSRFCHKIGHAK